VWVIAVAVYFVNFSVGLGVGSSRFWVGGCGGLWVVYGFSGVGLLPGFGVCYLVRGFVCTFFCVSWTVLGFSGAPFGEGGVGSAFLVYSPWDEGVFVGLTDQFVPCEPLFQFFIS